MLESIVSIFIGSLTAFMVSAVIETKRKKSKKPPKAVFVAPDFSQLRGQSEIKD